MQATIGNRLLASLEPTEKPFEVRDAKLKGFILRVQPNGIIFYIVEYGRGKRITLGKAGVLTPAQTRDRAIKILADVVNGADPMAERKAAKAHDLKGFLTHEYGPWATSHRKGGSRGRSQAEVPIPGLRR